MCEHSVPIPLCVSVDPLADFSSSCIAGYIRKSYEVKALPVYCQGPLQRTRPWDRAAESESFTHTVYLVLDKLEVDEISDFLFDNSTVNNKSHRTSETIK